jgi:hypothetical protein
MAISVPAAHKHTAKTDNQIGFLKSDSHLQGTAMFVRTVLFQPSRCILSEPLLTTGRIPVFFTPNDPQDIEQYGQPAWCSDINWLLLDCDD